MKTELHQVAVAMVGDSWDFVPRGIMSATVSDEDPEMVLIGYSFTNPVDKFNRSYGIELAKKRGNWLKYSNHIRRRIHPRFRSQLYSFIMRSKKYFKDKRFPNWCNAYLEDESIKRDVKEEIYQLPDDMRPKWIKEI